MKIWTRLSPPTTPSEARPRGQGNLPAARPAAGARLPALPRSPSLTLPVQGARPNLLRRHPFALVVLLPTLLAGLYLFFVAAPQYYSETRFTVRSQAAGPASLLGGALSAAGFKAASEEAAGVRDYLLSHDAVRALRERIDLVGVFRRPEADPLLRLWAAEPTAEKLLDFYRAQVSATINPGSGITELRVRSFRPEDSLEISRHLLGLGEEMVNRMNTRLQEESLRAARAEVARAQAQAAEAQTAVTAFRQREQAVDPQRSATIAVETIGRLEGEAARARAELQQLSTFARPGNPQVQNIRNRVDGLETQIAEERRRLSAAGTGVTEQIATFERLRLEAEFATRSLAVGMTTLERAQAEALRQQVFLVRIVEPNLAERSLYPKPLVTTAYVFAGLALLYGLGWLLLAGVREHAA